MIRPTLAACSALGLFAGVAGAQLTPAMLQYQFNEVRGTVVANTASGTTIPATGTMNGTTWMSDPGRPLFRGNEAGFGCLGYRGVNAFWAHTGWHINYAGSLTIMFWMQRDVASTSTNPFGYAFGDVGFRAFAAGGAGQGITFRGTVIGNVDSGFSVIATPGVWQHVTLVVDNAAGQARWWDNGNPTGNLVNFTPNSFAYSNTTRFMAVGAQGDSGLSTFSNNYAMDDFRFYDRALTQPEILAAMQGENPSAGVYGAGCPGPGGLPAIAGNGLPQLGNPAFAITLGNGEDLRLTAIVLGLAPATFGPIDLGWLLGTGCALQHDWFSATFHVVQGGAATQTVGIPNNPMFSGFHVYGQWLIAGTSGAASLGLDVNVR